MRARRGNDGTIDVLTNDMVVSVTVFFMPTCGAGRGCDILTTTLTSYSYLASNIKTSQLTLKYTVVHSYPLLPTRNTSSDSHQNSKVGGGG